ncbi:C40 family peptidase [Neptunitalea lumnitzerae]|uniref:NlpC/P60 domain-containing protein n=1 Tax=Neptunitalea lumnitzerae TaxID=2965509 RepID=A0ABQ5MHC4_9FLAO|nr:C40 family peptidase [Neptunitalea sp. Y10]GLB48701.1 hypothetical protein Y10_10690 [Neptunitalea sp. Y10]
MKKLLFVLLGACVVTSCSSSKTIKTSKSYKQTHNTNTTVTTSTNAPDNTPYSVTVGANTGKTVKGRGEAKGERTTTELLVIDNIINEALGYLGTRYKYGGTTDKGMDCSGLVYTSFLSQNIAVQRSSYLLSEEGKSVSIKDVLPGDLLFFITGKGRKINHVAMVIEASPNDVKFIHSTTSRGVIISSIQEGYWGSAFKFARRMQL